MIKLQQSIDMYYKCRNQYDNIYLFLAISGFETLEHNIPN